MLEQRIEHQPVHIQPENFSEAASNYRRVVTNDYESIEVGNIGYYTHRGIGNYDALLPQFDGLSFSRVVQATQETTGRKASVLDIGCGQGIMLAQMICGYNIEATGVAATDLRAYADQSLMLAPYLQAIDLRVGDIRDILKLLGNKKFDFITSVKTFEHVTNPLEVIAQCEGLLKPGGIAFIENGGEKSILRGRTTWEIVH